MLGSDDYRADHVEEAEVEVEVSAVHKELITLATTHLDSDSENAEVKSELCVANSTPALLTAL